MGQEIPHSFFTEADFQHYHKMLEDESRLLRQWFDRGAFDSSKPVAGCELEVWLVDENGMPAPVNAACLKDLDEGQASPELSQFNIELNFNPMPLKNGALSGLHDSLRSGWTRLAEVAKRHGAGCVLIGILPTVRDEHLTLDYISPLNRYFALNEQVLAQRKGRPIEVNIVGHDHLRLDHYDVMLESVTTSFQIHMQVPQDRAARYLNASMITSAPLVAISANSPYLFGYDLWAETRIPVFEQSICARGYGHAADGPLRRVTYGSDYVRESLWECFEENLRHYPMLLPHDFNQPIDRMSHLQLHNGTIWRWNRPLVGFSDNHLPHLRIEQRVVPAGPALVDMVANMAFYYGLVESLATTEQRPEMQLEFAMSRDNFYKAARYGLDAHIRWLDGGSYSVKRLILDHLLELSWSGLEQLRIDREQARYWLGIIEQRAISEQTGSVWQRKYVEHYGQDMTQLLKSYRKWQGADVPVHEWSI